jgi:hypothetical protein
MYSPHKRKRRKKNCSSWHKNFNNVFMKKRKTENKHMLKNENTATTVVWQVRGTRHVTTQHVCNKDSKG